MFSIEFAAAAAAAALAAAAPAPDGPAYTVDAPIAHENLAIYLVRGPSAEGPVPLTLQEAMDLKLVKVRETGDVNELVIENGGGQEVFIQAGDIVKGGQQDRVLSASLILPPKSGEVPIAAFCVEQGRWSQRGDEDSRVFAGSYEALPSREAKLAMRAPAPAADEPRDFAAQNVQGFGGAVYERQGAVWSSVSKIQKDLSDNLAVDVVAAESPTSLQLALENEAVDLEVDGYLGAFAEAGADAPDVVGFVAAVNGELVSADLYPSHGLFAKMWDKNLRAAATEALTHAAAEVAETPDAAAALAFLESGADGDEHLEEVSGARLKTRVSEAAYAFDAERADGVWVHRNVLAK